MTKLMKNLNLYFNPPDHYFKFVMARMKKGTFLQLVQASQGIINLTLLSNYVHLLFIN